MTKRSKHYEYEPEWSAPIGGGCHIDVMAILEPYENRPKRLFHIVLRTPSKAKLGLGDITEAAADHLSIEVSQSMAKEFGINADEMKQAVSELQNWLIARTVMKS